MRKLKLRDLLILLIGALFVRALYLVSLSDSPLFAYPQIDGRLFWESALAMASGAAGGAPHYKPPGLASLLALSIRLFGENPGTARVLLGLLSALAAPLTALIARDLLAPRAALIAGALVALSAPAVFYGAELLPAGTVLLLNLGALLTLIHAEARGSRLGAGAGGLLIGLSACTRPTILLLIPLLLIRYRKRMKLALPLIVGALIAISPVTLHNLRGGSTTLISANGGINFYMGNHEGSDGKSAVAPELPNEPRAALLAAVAIAEGEAGRSLPPSGVSHYWMSKGVGWVLAKPGAALRLVGRKFYYLWNAREISDNIDFHAIAAENRALGLLPVRFWPLFAFALAGLPLLWRRSSGRLLLLYGLAVTLPPLLFFVVGRFRLPLIPLLAIAAVAGAIEIWQALRNRERRGVLLLVVVMGGAALSLSGFFGAGDDARWHYHYLCGDVHYRQGDSEQAIAAFERSLDLNSDNAMTMNSLAFLYAETGTRLGRALELIERAIQTEPGRARFYLDSKGWVLYKRNEYAEAESALLSAIARFRPGEEAARNEAEGHLALVRQAMKNR